MDFSKELFEKYQKALGSAGIGLWEWNLKDGLVRWDAGIQKLYGISEEIFESDGASWYKRIHPEDHAQVHSILSVDKEDRGLSSTFRIIMPDSTIRYIRTSAYQVRNEKNEVISLVGLSWDVTNELLLQQESRQSKIFLESIMNALPDPLFVKDRSYRWIFANSEFEKIVGETKEQFLGKTDYDFFSKERADGYREHDQAVFESGQSKENEEKVTDNKGITREILTKKSVFNLNKDEQILVGVIRDITEKNHTDSRFRLMISLIDSSVDLFGFTDASGVPLYVNRTAKEVFGVEVGKRFFTDYLAPSDKALVDNAIAKSLKNFEKWEGEVLALNPKTQQEIPVLLKIFSVRTGPKLNEIFYGCSGTNLTEVKKIQKSLIEQSKMASLGEMAAEIAHEVNNPLMIVQAKAQMLQSKIADSPDREKIIKDLKLIEKNSIRIDKIIKSLKTASRRSEQDPFESVPILNLIEEALELSRERFRLNDIALTFKTNSVCDYSHFVYARSTEIVQVLVNLLNNSFDAVKDRDVRWVEIQLSCDDSDYQIEVLDSGPLIPPEISEKIFLPFYTTKPSGQGTGLGLSLSKQIIQNHDGIFYFDPKSAYTRFVFTLKKPEFNR